MTAYSNSDAARDLRPALDKAPAGAVNGEWFFITEQAGVSSQTGGYMYADGSHVAEGNHALQKVREVVEKLEAARVQPFNKVIVHWTRSKIPLIRGRVTVEKLFDETIVPRGPQDPIYEVAAVARRAFWERYNGGKVLVPFPIAKNNLIARIAKLPFNGMKDRFLAFVFIRNIAAFVLKLRATANRTFHLHSSLNDTTSTCKCDEWLSFP